ncbi:MAG TPA: hypothetical protein VD767_01905 [Thermomicrobiales bacterium]|nr:hypothetical protein [Thermomicrobiales bacterium]
MTPRDPDPAGSIDPALDDLYHSIVSRHAANVLDHADQTIADRGSIDEPGMLRIVLARLLLHESNAGQLAARASTLANAMARLLAIQRRDRDPGHDDMLELDALIDDRDAALAAAFPGPEGAPE